MRPPKLLPILLIQNFKWLIFIILLVFTNLVLSSSNQCDGDSCQNYGHKQEDIYDNGIATEDLINIGLSLIFCFIGTCASSGDLIWTAILYLYLMILAWYWASDKTEELGAAVKKLYFQKPDEKKKTRGQFHYRNEL